MLSMTLVYSLTKYSMQLEITYCQNLYIKLFTEKQMHKSLEEKKNFNDQDLSKKIKKCIVNAIINMICSFIKYNYTGKVQNFN